MKYLWGSFHGPQSFPATPRRFWCRGQWWRLMIDQIAEPGTQGHHGGSLGCPCPYWHEAPPGGAPGTAWWVWSLPVPRWPCWPRPGETCLEQINNLLIIHGLKKNECQHLNLTTSCQFDDCRSESELGCNGYLHRFAAGWSSPGRAQWRPLLRKRLPSTAPVVVHHRYFPRFPYEGHGLRQRKRAIQ